MVQEKIEQIIKDRFSYKNGSEKSDLVSHACIQALRGNKGRAIKGRGKWGLVDKTKDVVDLLRKLGFDAVALNDAPRGGKNGNYVVVTYFRDKDREARKKFVKEAREIIRWAAYRECAQSSSFIQQRAEEMVSIFKSDVVNDLYHGCGVYRVGWRNGQMTCAIKGGYTNSLPYLTPLHQWTKAVEEIMYKHADHIVMMFGSGTEFFFQNFQDADLVTNATRVYFVPKASGGRHLNIVPTRATVIEVDRLT